MDWIVLSWGKWTGACSRAASLTSIVTQTTRKKRLTDREEDLSKISVHGYKWMMDAFLRDFGALLQIAEHFTFRVAPVCEEDFPLRERRKKRTEFYDAEKLTFMWVSLSVLASDCPTVADLQIFVCVNFYGSTSTFSTGSKRRGFSSSRKGQPGKNKFSCNL